MDGISLLLMLAQKGNSDAEAQLVALYEPLINKFAKQPNGIIDQDCKQQLTIAFILAVRRFDLSRYK